MSRKINVTFSDAANKEFQFVGTDELLKFLKKESIFWANVKHKMDGVADNDIHEYIKSSDDRFDPCISDIEKLCRGRRVRTLNINDGIKEALRAHLGNYWLWSEHGYISSFIKINRELGLHAADSFIHMEITLAGLNNKFETFKSQFESWGTETREKWDALLSQSSKAHDVQQSKHDKDFKQFIESSNSELADLKKKYEEDLRYSAPVQYWRDAVKKYKWQGTLWVVMLVISLVAGLGGFTILFNTWLKGHTTVIQLETVQGVILFGAILAAFAFLVRILSRLAFSSYHLMRDAEERETLTYIYLSLLSENRVDESSRDIILQVLFSRTETGLLAGDSTPSMPGLGADAINSAMKQPGK